MSSETEQGPLPADAIVIRAGVLELESLSDRFDAHFDKHHHKGVCRPEPRHQCFSVSVNCIPTMTAEQIAEAANHLHPKMRRSTVARIRDAGFVVDPTPNSPTGHCDVYLASGPQTKPDLKQMFDLQSAFDPAERYPGRP